MWKLFLFHENSVQISAWSILRDGDDIIKWTHVQNCTLCYSFAHSPNIFFFLKNFVSKTSFYFAQTKKTNTMYACHMGIISSSHRISLSLSIYNVQRSHLLLHYFHVPYQHKQKLWWLYYVRINASNRFQLAAAATTLYTLCIYIIYHIYSVWILNIDVRV